MEKKHIIQILEERKDDYRRIHPATAEMDLSIVDAISYGKSVVQISMGIPCSESTVYRAIQRVQDYLKVLSKENIVDTLLSYVADNPPNYGDWNAKSVLEMLYVAYGEYNNLESEESKAGFDDLYAVLRELPLENVDCVIDKVCDIAHCHERDGFTEGVKLGVRLGNELKM